MKILFFTYLVLFSIIAKSQVAFELINRNELDSLSDMLIKSDSNWFGDKLMSDSIEKLDILSYALLNKKRKAAELIYEELKKKEVILSDSSVGVVINQAYFTALNMWNTSWTKKLLSDKPDIFSSVFKCECSSAKFAIIENNNWALSEWIQNYAFEFESLSDSLMTDLMLAAIEGDNQDMLAFLFFIVKSEYYLSIDELFFEDKEYLKSVNNFWDNLWVVEEIGWKLPIEKVERVQNDVLLEAITSFGSLKLNEHFLRLPLVTEGLLLSKTKRVDLSTFGDILEKPTKRNAKKLKFILRSYIELNDDKDEVASEDLFKLQEKFLEKNKKNFARVCQDLIEYLY